MKWLFGLLLLISSVAWGVEPQYSLLRNDTITIEEPVLSAYLLQGDILKVEVQNSKPVITALNVGTAIVQILQVNGQVNNIIIKVNPKPRDKSFTKNNSNDLMNGHSVSIKSFYQERWSNTTVGPYSNYGVNVVLYTAIEKDASFYARFNKIDMLPLNFYTKFKKNKNYIAYGDDTVLSNEIIPSFIGSPMLRQILLGRENSDGFSFDLWSGQNSPYNYGLNSPNPGGYIFLDRENSSSAFYKYSTRDSDWLSGLRMSYNFGEKNKHSVFASTMYNPISGKHIPYVGARVNMFSNMVTTRFAVGGDNERPVGVYNISYKDPFSKKWTLRSANLNHQIATKGYDTLLATTNVPREDISLGLEFYDVGRFDSKGSVYLTPSASYYMNGNSILNSYGATLGWQNSVFTGYILGQKSESFQVEDPDYDKESTGSNVVIRPGIQLWLQKQTAPVKYRIGAYQNFSSNLDGLGNEVYKGQETSWDLLRRQGDLDLGIRVGRLSTESMYRTVSGYSLHPYLTYRADKFMLGLYSSFVFNDSLSEDLEMVYNRVRLQASKEINKNLRLSASYSKTSSKRTYGELNYNHARVDLTWRFGDQERPITEFFRGTPVKGEIYEDLNFNGKKDDGEPVKKGISVYLTQKGEVKKSTQTDSDGKFEFDNVDYEEYQFAIADQSSEQIIYNNLPGKLDFAKRQTFSLNIPYFSATSYYIKFDSKDQLPDFIPLILDCKKSGQTQFTAKNQDVKFMVPLKDECLVKLDLNNNYLKNFMVDKNNVALGAEKNIRFEISLYEPKLIGVVYHDKNNNGLFDIGEQMVNSRVTLSGGVVTKTDESGSFAVEKKKLGAVVEFIRINNPKLHCTPIPSKIMAEEVGTKSLTIKCQNN